MCRCCGGNKQRLQARSAAHTMSSCHSSTMNTRHPMPAMPACKSNLRSIAVLQPVPLKCVLKLQRIKCTTVVAARIPDFAAYIIDGGQGWPAAVVSFNITIISSATQEKFERSRAAAIFTPCNDMHTIAYKNSKNVTVEHTATYLHSASSHTMHYVGLAKARHNYHLH